MATARISESLWTCSKRRALEARLKKDGHRWPDGRSGAPMCAAECVARVLAVLDSRSRPDGDMTDLDAEAVESAAGWDGKPGRLVDALVACGWIDATPAGMFWHDYGAFNGMTIRDRLKKRNARGVYRGVEQHSRTAGQPGGHDTDKQGDAKGDKLGDAAGDAAGEVVGDEVGAYGSGSGSGSGVRVQAREDPPPTEDRRDPPAGAKRAAPKHGPQESAARALAKSLGSSLAPCRKQVAALVASGWDVGAVDIAVREHAEPGLAPWDWTKRARGTSREGLTTQQILEVGRKLQAKYDADHPNGNGDPHAAR